jgi:hypothetical protein
LHRPVSIVKRNVEEEKGSEFQTLEHWSFLFESQHHEVLIPQENCSYLQKVLCGVIRD